jgi:hypothetical protein
MSSKRSAVYSMRWLGGSVGRKKIDIKDKKLFLNFVYLAEAEYALLCALLGKEETDRWIEELNGALGQHGYKYESHYWTIRNWARKKTVRSAECGVRSKDGDKAERAAEVVIEALKNPLHRSMPEFTTSAHQAAYTALARMGLSWPELKRRIAVEGPNILDEFRAQFLRAYAANAECGVWNAE